MAAPISGPGGGSPKAAAAAVIPAQLGFLAIYNPSLGATDETMEDQIVYYSSVQSAATARPRSSSPEQQSQRKGSGSGDGGSNEDRNERLRQIGLAQGMVEFGRSFSGDRAVDTVETEKSRVVLHELEPGWWVLASVDLTRLPVPAGKSAGTSGTAAKGKTAEKKKDGGVEEEPAVEYSAREVKPAALLLQDLLRAHSVFLLHHGSSLSALFVRANRQRFTSLLSRFWDLFLASWNVMLHGNPLRNIFAGIKIAASGELGFGVGEEERGSGEREVLEGLAGRIDGLVDLVVGKFGEGDEGGHGKLNNVQGAATEPWLGTGNEPAADDGAIFLGVGALSRHSVRDLTFWMEDIYTWGESAYGVKESPTSRRLQARRKKLLSKQTPASASPAPAVRVQSPEPSHPADYGPPAPIVKPAAKPAPRSTARTDTPGSGNNGKDAGSMDKMMGYLKLGYGTYWSLSSSSAVGDAERPTQSDDQHITKPPLSRNVSASDAAGHYLIGLMGDVDETAPEESEPPGEEGHNSRILLRTLTVELESEATDKTESQMSHDLGSNDTELAPQSMKHHRSPASSNQTIKNNQGSNTTRNSTVAQSNYSNSSRTSDRSGDKTDNDKDQPREGAQNQQTEFDSQDRNKTKKVRVVVYAAKPFVFVLLFDLHTDSLNWDAAYRSLHQQLAPLRKPLLASTAYRPDHSIEGMEGAGQKIYDLVWDPQTLTVHSSIPNIPTGKTGEGGIWTRVEALNTHVQLLNTWASTRGVGREMELERTAKTSRGWWIVWSRVLERDAAAVATNSGTGSSSPREAEDDEQGEGRQRGDGASGESSSSGDERITPTQDGQVVGKEIFLIRKSGEGSGFGGVRSYVSVGGGGGGGWTDGASRLAQGLGVDTRKYIEGLLSLNR